LRFQAGSRLPAFFFCANRARACYFSLMAIQK
jgi:hypothetical protein